MDIFCRKHDTYIWECPEFSCYPVWNMINYSQRMLKDAHKHSRHNFEELSDSYLCACFHCCTLFAIEKITEWTDKASDDGATALCPVCGIDAVLGNRAGFPIHEGAFVRAMNTHWFQDGKKTKKK